jgi:hypothetical protein
MQGWDKANQILQARLQPQMEQAREAQASQLVNQGIPVGSKAYENAMRTFNQGQNDLLTNSQLAGQSIGNNLFNQGLAGGQFTNAAITQQNQNQLANTGLSNAAIAQNFGQNLQAQQLQNQAAQQNYSNQIAGTQLGNQAAQQNYGNQLAGLQFNNQTGQQGYANQLAQIQANNAANQQGYANSQQQQQANNALAQQYYANQQAQQQANNAMRFYENQEGIYNAPENHYPENIVLGCNGVHNCFHGCTCQRWGLFVRLFLYQCIVKRFYPYAGNWGNGNGLPFLYMVLICICVHSFISFLL